MLDRQWGATMVLTEPDAGSDVGAGRTKAVQQPDGSWHIEGVKRFITSAEHDLTDNIVHLVLARPEGARPGHQGPVAVRRPQVPRRPRDRRARRAQRRLRHQRREEDGPQGLHDLRAHLRRRPSRPSAGCVGEVHDGIAQMFKVIEYARMIVGTKAIATLSTGYLNALDYAKDPRAGRRPRPRTDKDRAAGHDHPPPRRAPLADAAEVVRRGHARARPVRRQRPGPGRAGRAPATAARTASSPSGSTTCCCRSSRATARSGRYELLAPSRCRPSAAPATCRTTRSSSTSATPRSTPSTRAPRRSRARTCSSARSSATRARR